ncbi:polyprenyl synthetase family protein [Humidisolicoccus flavus]|uniref:polyprenyl synthetase family protein n=1 Tax=Humidisolicoccus flavus TaxID=3111414 RepID=UPI003254A6E9
MSATVGTRTAAMQAIFQGTPAEHAHEAVQARIEALLARRTPAAQARGGDFGRLWEHLRDATRGGKGLRPRLVTSVADAFGTIDDNVITTAAVFEILHTAFLLHDDVIDQDTLRRGALNIAGHFMQDAGARGMDAETSRIAGTAAAILAGDLLISLALRTFAELDVDREIHRELFDVVEDAILSAAAGELEDVRYASGVIASEDEIVQMIAHKTAGYSFVAPMVAGAILAGAQREAVEALERIGQGLGLVFQLRDDILGVFGDAETGKSAIGDLREGKQTLLIAFARQCAQWNEVESVFGTPTLSEADATRIRHTLEQCGARAAVEAEIRRVFNETRTNIQEAPLPESLQHTLLAFLQESVDRRR